MTPSTRLSVLFLAGALVLIVFWGPGVGRVAQAEPRKGETAIVPEREIQSTVPVMPLWKRQWDTARSCLRVKQYSQAAQIFEQLFQLKPNLYEARAEYTAMLIEMGDWEKAEESNNILLAHEPERLQHQYIQAKLALHTGRLPLAVHLFSDLYVNNPTGEKGDLALKGLIQGLERQGNTEQAILLMEQLLRRTPDDQEIVAAAGLLFLHAGVLERAQDLLLKASKSLPRDISILEGLAQTFELQGEPDKASRYWQEIVTVDPFNTQANRSLSRYYERHQNVSMQMHHLKALAQQDALTDQETLRLVQLYIDIGRSDFALDTCTLYLSQHADNADVAQLRNKALALLAEELLILVEHENTNTLWEDLSHITPSRFEVFSAIAALLREKKKYTELADVLMIMADEKPGNQPIWHELEALLKKQGRTRELAALYDNRSKEKEQKVN
ncbi:MAG: hypothetical protein CSA33_07200 [Desulfobulbus propionicus]|nr:MAG: hypothetical protein CSA33_07200 [Desulfobulbus propionicus]